jgi:hypothetical protein
LPDGTKSIESGVLRETPTAVRGRWIQVWLLALLLTALTTVVHLTSPSSFYLKDAIWQARLNLHYSADVFRVRPLTSAIVTFLTTNYGLSIKTAFLSLQFTLFFLTCPAVYFYLKQLGYNHRYSIVGMIMFMLSLPVFLAHFDPVYTWSDFWMYLMVPLSLGWAIKNKLVLSALAMAIALVARETTLIFLPILCLMIYRRYDRGWLKAPLIGGLTIVLFLIIRAMFVGFFFPEPEYGFYSNFNCFLRIRGAIFSVIVSLGFIWVVGLYQTFRKSEADSQYGDIVRFGAIISVIACIVSTLIFGKLRESRLFMPAAIFLIPLVLTFIKSRMVYIRELFVARYKKWTIYIALLALLIFSVLIAKSLFPEFEYRPWHDGNWTYLGIHITLTIIFLIVEIYRKRAPAIEERYR